MIYPRLNTSQAELPFWVNLSKILGAIVSIIGFLSFWPGSWELMSGQPYYSIAVDEIYHCRIFCLFRSDNCFCGVLDPKPKCSICSDTSSNFKFRYCSTHGNNFSIFIFGNTHRNRKFAEHRECNINCNSLHGHQTLQSLTFF